MIVLLQAEELPTNITNNRNKTEKGTARGYQNIMGFSGGTDKERNARR
jgi:hypothetical protein